MVSKTARIAEIAKIAEIETRLFPAEAFNYQFWQSRQFWQLQRTVQEYQKLAV